MSFYLKTDEKNEFLHQFAANKKLQIRFHFEKAEHVKQIFGSMSNNMLFGTDLTLSHIKMDLPYRIVRPSRYVVIFWRKISAQSVKLFERS